MKSIDNYEILYRGNLPTGKRSVPQPELLEQVIEKLKRLTDAESAGLEFPMN